MILKSRCGDEGMEKGSVLPSPSDNNCGEEWLTFCGWILAGKCQDRNCPRHDISPFDHFWPPLSNCGKPRQNRSQQLKCRNYLSPSRRDKETSNIHVTRREKQFLEDVLKQSVYSLHLIHYERWVESAKVCCWLVKFLPRHPFPQYFMHSLRPDFSCSVARHHSTMWFVPGFWRN